MRAIYDGATFQWLRYLETDNFEEDNALIIENVMNEQANLGLISALLLTVFTTFFQGAAAQYFDPPSGGNFGEPFSSRVLLIHMLLWLLASVSILLATLFSVFMYLAIAEGKNELEKRHFLNLFDACTFGFGSKFTLTNVYLSFIAGAIGLFFYIAINCGIYQLFYCFFIFIPIFGLFCIFYLQLTSCLYCARKTGTRIVMETKGSHFTIGEVKEKLKEYIQSKQPSNADTVDPNALGPDDNVEKFVDFMTPEGSKLCLLTEKRARRLFEMFLDANCFGSVSLLQLDLNKNYGDKVNK